MTTVRRAWIPTTARALACAALLGAPAGLVGQAIAVAPVDVTASASVSVDVAALAEAVRVTVMVGVMERGFTLAERSPAGALLAKAGQLASGGAVIYSDENLGRTLRTAVSVDSGRFSVTLRLVGSRNDIIARDQGEGRLADAHAILLGLQAPVMPTLSVAPRPQTPLPLGEFESFGFALLALDRGQTDRAFEILRRIAAAFPDFLPAALLLRGAR